MGKMRINHYVVGMVQTNCYIVWAEGSKTCAVIDPGDEAERILKNMEDRGLTLEAVLLTHGHFDHVGAVETIVTKTGCALWMNESDYSQFPSPIIAHYFPLANCDFTQVQFCEDGEEISAGGLTFTALSTPGHTAGSVCFACEDALFSGDTLFSGSCGRTDLPGGDSKFLRASLERLRELKENYTVYPGHGESTTLAWEKMYNPYLR